MKVLRKSQFTDDGNGNFKKRFHIKPKDDNQVIRPLESGSVSYASSDENVATVEEDAADQRNFDLVWKGPGNVTVTATGDADLDQGEDKFVSGTEDFKLEDDEATSIVIEEGNAE